MSFQIVDIEKERETDLFYYRKHSKFFVRFLKLLPARLASHDCTRGTIAFFAVCGLDLLGDLDILTPNGLKEIIEWTYRGLIAPVDGEQQKGGFQGARAFKVKTDDEQKLANARKCQCGHLALTYTSISILVTLKDDLSRLDRKMIVDGVAATQQPDGSFSACIGDSENDMRFVYCAAAICNMLDYWGDVDKEKMYQFIMSSLRYDYGFSQHSDCEAHGGTTFCAIAALELSGQLHRLNDQQIEGIKRWLIMRQINGFQGRPNKPSDTCYSFWIGASLRILNAFHLIDYGENRRFIMKTQDNFIGGFAKWPSSTPDPFHSYFGMCGLSFIGEPGLIEIMPSLNITMKAYKHLQKLQESWRIENVEDKFINFNGNQALNATTITEETPLNA